LLKMRCQRLPDEGFARHFPVEESRNANT